MMKNAAAAAGRYEMRKREKKAKGSGFFFGEEK